MRSLADTVSTTIGLDSAANNGATFQLMSGATAGMEFNNRQFELIENGNSATNLGRQARIQNNSDQAFTISTALLVTGTGSKKLFLDSSTASGNNNNFNGVIIDAIGADVLTLYKAGTGTWNLGGVNTYEGNTIVDAGTLTLSTNAELLFVIGALGENNGIVGDASNATVNLNGLFRFNLTGASTTVNDFWNIVDEANLTETYGGTFDVASTNGGFTETALDSGIWTRSENGTTYEFTESNGVLTVIPEPSAALLGAIGFLALLRRRR
jgi:autotransporter-associated beta strand protein